MQRDIAQSIYANLKDFKIEMPHNYIGGNSGGTASDGGQSGKLMSNLDVITALGALGVMGGASNLASNGFQR